MLRRSPSPPAALAVGQAMVAGVVLGGVHLWRRQVVWGSCNAGGGLSTAGRLAVVQQWWQASPSLVHYIRLIVPQGIRDLKCSKKMAEKRLGESAGM